MSTFRVMNLSHGDNKSLRTLEQPTPVIDEELAWPVALSPGRVTLGIQHLFASVCFRNKVIWVGIASQVIVALILSYGLGSVPALSFTMLR